MRLAPPGVSAAEARPLPGRVPALGTRRAVVGMLTGCVQSVFFPRVNAATARVLAAEGCDVIIPRGQGCCGALSLHSGREAEAGAFARRTIATFEQAGVDAVVVNSAGCGSAMKEYERLLRGADGGWAERAAEMSGKVKDLAEFLAELGPAAPRHPLPVTAAYHDACHLAHAQRITRQPRDLLRAIPGLTLVEVPDAGTCCGSAGVYNLLQPAAAASLAPARPNRCSPPARRCSSRPTPAARCRSPPPWPSAARTSRSRTPPRSWTPPSAAAGYSTRRDFRHIKSDDLDLRPVFHRLEHRVKGHVLICMLAAYLTWHLRQAWAPLTYTDEDPPVQANPVTPAKRSPSAQAKASRQHDQDGPPTAASKGYSPTWAPSPATSCASPTPPPPSPSSPSPPANNARPSSSSARPSRSPCPSSQKPPAESTRTRRPAAVSASKQPVTSG